MLFTNPFLNQNFFDCRNFPGNFLPNPSFDFDRFLKSLILNEFPDFGLSPHAGDPNNDGFQFQSYYISLEFVILRVGFSSETFFAKTSTRFGF